MESPVRKMLKRNDYNRHKLLRKIKRQRKARAEQEAHAAEKELKKRLKLKMPRYEDGKDDYYTAYVDDINQTRVNPETGGVLVLDLDGSPIINEGGYQLPNYTVTPNKYKSTYDKDLVNNVFGTAIDFTPIVGDAKQWTDAGEALSNKNYSEAAMLSGLGLIPNIIEKPFNFLKKGFKLFKGNKNITNNVTSNINENIEKFLEKQYPGRNIDRFLVNDTPGLGTSVLDFIDKSQLHGESLEMAKLLSDAGVDLTKYNSMLLSALTGARKKELIKNGDMFLYNVPGYNMQLYNKDRLLGRVDYYNRQNTDPLGIVYIENLSDITGQHVKGVSEDLYNGLIQYAHQTGREGVTSGEQLISPEATTKVWNHFPNVKTISNDGVHDGVKNSRVVLLSQPTRILPLKESVFDPRIIDSEGNMIIDWNKGPRYKNGKD